MQTATPTATDLTRMGRRTGYAVAVLVNLGMVFVVANIQGWDIVPFLTEAFDDVAPWIISSLMLSVVANVIYQFDDRRPIKAAGEGLSGIVSVVVTYRVLDVFPFDFTRYEFDWAILVRVLLILAMVGAGAGVLVQLGRLIPTPALRQDRIEDV